MFHLHILFLNRMTLLTMIFSFLTMFSDFQNDFYLLLAYCSVWTCLKFLSLLTLSQTSPGSYVSALQLFENTVRKGEIAHKEQFLLFPHCFLSVWRTFYHFQQIRNCRLQTVWERVKKLKSNSRYSRFIYHCCTSTSKYLLAFKYLNTSVNISYEENLWKHCWKKIDGLNGV